jgi:hypothetical protein
MTMLADGLVELDPIPMTAKKRGLINLKFVTACMYKSEIVATM